MFPTYELEYFLSSETTVNKQSKSEQNNSYNKFKLIDHLIISTIISSSVLSNNRCTFEWLVPVCMVMKSCLTQKQTGKDKISSYRNSKHSSLYTSPNLVSFFILLLQKSSRPRNVYLKLKFLMRCREIAGQSCCPPFRIGNFRFPTTLRIDDNITRDKRISC